MIGIRRVAPSLSKTRLSPLATIRQSSSEQASDSTSLEDTYSRKTPLEHILLRPAMYVGPTERLPATSSWVLRSDVTPQLNRNSPSPSPSPSPSSPWTMQRQELSYVPALLKIFDEILVNASDNRLRHPGSCDRIDVILHRGGNADASDELLSKIPDPSQPYISVSNNGKSIPVQIHRKEKMYIPELLFGHLLTGSNFDDDQKRLTGGRHGYGAKLTNVFSKRFVVEIADSHSSRGVQKTYKQEWEQNMSVCHEAQVTTLSKDGNTQHESEYTRISFVPDLERLVGIPKTTTIPEEEYMLMKRRVVDIAGCSGGKLTVTLNGNVIDVSGFREYVNLYRHVPPDATELPPILYHRLNSRWEIAVGLSEQKSFESISFVNGMNTSRGGTHVDVIARQVSQYIADYVNSKMAKQLDRLQGSDPAASNVTQRMVRRHLFVCVNSLIENPSFDSQMKEHLTSSPDNFGSQFDLPTSFLKKLIKPINVPGNDDDEMDDNAESDISSEVRHGGPGIVEEIFRTAMGAHQINLSKLLKELGGGKQSKRQVLSIPKLEDANLAGSTSVGTGNPCTLILTEGDSAKALAVAGLEIVGRDRYGVFPLRGKFINVRNVSLKQLANNAELKAMCTILGLQFDKKYETREERQELRYGHVMLMADQDADGSHIKGLIMNMFRYYWPALLKPPMNSDTQPRPFLSMFITPILKATKSKQSISFFSMSEYKMWRESMDIDEVRRWSIKYYKGLGTSTPAEAKDYFLSFVRHYRPFRWQSEQEDGERIDMAFEHDRADDRKSWILNVYDEKSTVSVDEKNDNSVGFGDFVDNELIHFSNANNIRSLPNVVDGLKPSQRKVLYGCFKRNLKQEIKVAQLSGYIAEHTAYHHGEASLHGTIIGMAQDFCGSNNINLLVPSGQFGTRLEGGKDSASPRYIFTQLSPITRLLFPVEDDVLLNYREEDGQIIEPDYFCPIIPMLLVNGCQGIGTGWSTFIPPHHPHDILNYIRARLDENQPPPIRPYVRGFAGTITAEPESGSYDTAGVITAAKSSINISELPIGIWTNDYKQILVNMLKKGEIQSFTQNHTTTTVSFDVKMNIAKCDRIRKGDMQKKFMLHKGLSTRNMHAFTTDTRIARYKTPEDIAEEYFPIRLSLYDDRKSVMESNMLHLASLTRNKARFIQAVSENEIDLLHGRTSRDAMVSRLEEMEFSKRSELEAIEANNTVAHRQKLNLSPEATDTVTDMDDSNDSSKEYDYLLNLPLNSLTTEKISSLNDETSNAEAKLNKIRSTTASDLWREDLDKLEPHLIKIL